ncbi:Uncharacterized protein Adt_35548 [Abeliophyllum distichum]|uniref:Uncharacterized protein n=1 Tax=Abeliophyllum distichum TaxID=126358 RepID=A0ABD1QF18_9LAMI
MRSYAGRTRICRMKDMQTRNSASRSTKETRYYNFKVKGKNFHMNDFVLKKVFQGNREVGVRILRLTWEEPYKIIKEIHPGTYRLEDSEGRETRHPWNITHLRPYYQQFSFSIS